MNAFLSSVSHTAWREGSTEKRERERQREREREIRLAWRICCNGHGVTFSENEAFVPSQAVH